MRILIVEDNPDIAGSVGDYLEMQGHVVDFAYDGVVGLRLASEHIFDAVILDINLPRMDGFEVCRQLREELQLDTPVLMLTARDSLADKVAGFQQGAWDYLVKPFELKELAMRLDALKLRRAPNHSRVLAVGDLTLNLDTWQAVRAGQSLKLHRASVRILEMLMRASPNVVTRQDIEFLLWGDESPGSDPLRSHMYELRRELDKPFEFNMLTTMRGIGFALSAEESEYGD
ncbi:response regulator transcription factor [Arenicella xantha]|uniref:DNA-binding response OmpR family regulator n=1 Tax=Arenicella xantha TaxID=644221 RepID=A0A395JJ81_9GAMM|nr:response regulator transcription factor [Arenicella xantha]RBP49913.1 DNA-binding response OmpR family regulator [Arenicella xantha]